jgi:hypothetical protein
MSLCTPEYWSSFEFLKKFFSEIFLQSVELTFHSLMVDRRQEAEDAAEEAEDADDAAEDD